MEASGVSEKKYLMGLNIGEKEGMDGAKEG